MTSLENCLSEINGQIIEAYAVCPRQAWFIKRGISLQWSSALVDLGRVVDEFYSKSLKRSHVHIDNVELDVVKPEKDVLYVYEIKKSSGMEYAHKIQLMYYLYVLEQKGVNATGILWYPKERKKVLVKLDKSEIESWIIRACQSILQETPPEVTKRPICSRCSYYEYCWV